MIRIGIVAPAEIAFRRFMPALKTVEGIQYIGVAIYNSFERFGKTEELSEQENAIIQREIQKGKEFIQEYGGGLFYSYEELICSDEIDAVYIPLPPALHDIYTKLALAHGKHVLVEKPSSISLERTEEIVELAREKELVLFENYMFAYHKQISSLKDIINSGKIGKVRLYSLKFGFPKRATGDFRDIKNMGGGSLLDAGGYTLKLAGMLLGESAEVICATLNQESEYDVDICGSATLINDEKITAQVAFGMDNAYKCQMEVWGSLGSIRTERIFTAPPGMQTLAIICCNGQEEIVELGEDDTFKKSIEMFCQCIDNNQERYTSYEAILKQARLVEQAMTMS